jgi:hypothetical protein
MLPQGTTNCFQSWVLCVNTAACFLISCLEVSIWHAPLLQGLRWMVGLAQHGLNGILADEMVSHLRTSGHDDERTDIA